MAWYRREIPIVICALLALIIIGEYFFVVPAGITAMTTEIKFWGTILAAFALMLGVFTAIRVNVYHVQKRTADRWYLALWTIIVMIVTTSVGLIYTPNNENYLWIYNNILQALFTTMMSTTGFFITSAAYRAFRARTTEAALLLISGCLVVAKNTPLLVGFWGGFTDIGNWIMEVAVSGGLRGIIIGAAIGAITIGLRTLLGLETGYLGILREK